jgi:hypothetical protein
MARFVPNRPGLSVAALLVALAVLVGVGWMVERLAYEDAREAEVVVEPLRGAAGGPPR